MARLEQVLFALGFVLLAAWGATELDRAVISRAAIAKFDALKTTKISSPVPTLSGLTSGSEVNFALWAVDRVRAYRASLLYKVDAPVAVLRIPKIHLEVPVFNGTGRLTLNRGVGRIEGTAQVGAGGNLGIAGHRDGFFRGLKDLAPGDVVELANLGQTDSYVIDWIQITKPDDVSVLKPTPAPSLTLVTCFPFHVVGSAPQRYVVRASRWNFAASSGGSSEDPTSTATQTKNKENEK